MRELQLDSIHDDGEHVVLTDSDGETYIVQIDEALRAAVRRDRPALGMLQSTESADLRPRDIQALLRSGRTAEEIAEMSGIDLEHVRRYEGPVLAERGYIAGRARSFHVGRGGGPTLGEITAERLRARQASAETTWDAWRREDGTWSVELAFEAGGRTREAHWIVDVARQSVVPADDEARWLTDDDVAPDPAPRPRAHLTAVRTRVYDVEADGGVEIDDEAPARKPWPGAARSARDEHPAAFGDEDLDALNARRGLRPLSRLAEDVEDRSEDDHPVEETSVWVAADDEADQEASAEHAADSERGAEEDEPQTEEAHGDQDSADEVVAEPVGEDTDEHATESHHGDTMELTPLPGFDATPAGTVEAAPAAPRRKPRTKRSSIPSWDEIVFGSKND